MEGYISVMLKLDNGDEISEREKHDCVCYVLATRLGIRLAEDSQLAGEISDRIGSMWTDLPMPVAAEDIPDSIIAFYNELNQP
jgi:hypothetical protein